MSTLRAKELTVWSIPLSKDFTNRQFQRPKTPIDFTNVAP